VNCGALDAGECPTRMNRGRSAGGALVPDPEASGLRTTVKAPFTGRGWTDRAGPGLVVMMQPVLDSGKRVDPDDTLATVPPFHQIDRSGSGGDVKIISYGGGAWIIWT